MQGSKRKLKKSLLLFPSCNAQTMKYRDKSIYTHQTSLSALSFPLLLEMVRERRFKNQQWIYKQDKYPPLLVFYSILLKLI